MKLLLLGGPRFLGRALTDSALERGHELTFFNRGTTNPGLYPEAERLLGDRASELSALAGRAWDAVIDTSGYLPAAVRAAAETLADSGLYCFVSSVSVYADFTRPTDEESPIAELGDLGDEVTAESYGALKALCEEAVRGCFSDRALVVRPGLIVGPHDPTGRFTYWPHRVARGGDVLAPGPSDRPTQFIDVRDLAEWTLTCANGVSPVRSTRPIPGFDVGGIARHVRGRDGDRRADHLGDRRVPCRARGRRVDGGAALGVCARPSLRPSSIGSTSVGRSRPVSRSGRSRRPSAARSTRGDDGRRGSGSRT